ncbi:MAG: hypothetical protein GY915_06325 [bacterium]|nr:hypothetical protein [bacterium]
MIDGLQGLSPYALYIVIGVLVLALVVGLGVLILASLAVRRAAKRRALAPNEPIDEAKEKKTFWQKICGFFAGIRDAWKGVPKDELAGSFVRTIDILKTYLGGKESRYKIPWYLMMGSEESGKTTLLENVGLELPIGRPDFEFSGERPPCGWTFFDQGIVLNLRGDYVLGKKEPFSNETGWAYFLGLLNRHRPKRSLDGIVLALSCKEFIGAEALSEDEWLERSKALHRKLWNIQSTLAMKVPVYVILTQTDSVPGFSDFVKELPETRRQEILGWSCPYDIDVAYSPSWVDELFDKMRRALRAVRGVVLSESSAGVTDQREQAFFFPKELQTLQEGLGVYLNTIFRDSVYHESFFLRGVFFSGDTLGSVESSSGAGVPVEGAQAPSQNQSLVFLRDLFARKIFPEAGLGHPIRRILVSTSRALNFSKVVIAVSVVLWAIGLMRVSDFLGSAKANIYPVLQQIERAVKGSNELSSDVQKPQLDVFLNEQSEAIIRLMSDLKEVGTFSIYIPSSWVSDLDQHIRESMTTAYDQIVLRSLFAELQKKGKHIVSPEFGYAASTQEGSLDPTKFPEFRALKTFMQGVSDLEKFVKAYNGLETSQSVEDIGLIVRFLFGRDLPSQFLEHSDYYQLALGYTRDKNIDITMFKEDARRKLMNLFDRYVDAVFDSRRNLEELTELLFSLQELTKPGAQFADEALRTILKKAQLVKEQVASADFQWVERSVFAPGDLYTALLNSIARSELLGIKVAGDLSSRADSRFKNYQKALLSMGTSLIPEIFQTKDGALHAQVSDRFDDLVEQINNFLGKPFMVLAGKTKRITAVPPGKLLFWDEVTLQRAVQMVTDYNSFVSGELADMAPELRGILQVVGRNSVRNRVANIIVRAETFHDEPATFGGYGRREMLASQIQNLKISAPLFTKILGTFEGGGFILRASGIRELLISESYKLLRKVDKLLENDNLYAVREGDFNWWDGLGVLGYQGFGVYDEDGMKAYLAAQRERVQFLAKEMAEPVIAFLNLGYLERTPNDLPLVLMWNRLVREMDAYDKKEPGNSLSLLEEYLLMTLNETTIENCSEQDEFRSGDYFLERRKQIRRALERRCIGIAGVRLSDNYNQMASFFNVHLAGRFPFIDNGVIGAGEAAPEDVNTFFQMFDMVTSSDKKALEKGSDYSSEKAGALRFLKKMEHVRPILRAALDPGLEQALPKLDFKVKFRTKREYEVGGNQIIDWSIFSGDQAVSWRDENTAGIWSTGSAVKIVFKWAGNGMFTPTSDISQDALEVTKNTATFNYGGRWGLVHLLQNHDAGALSKGVGAQTLKFVIPTTSVAHSRGDIVNIAGDSGNAVLFMDIQFTTAEGEEEIEVDPEVLKALRFPVQAPTLSVVRVR